MKINVFPFGQRCCVGRKSAKKCKKSKCRALSAGRSLVFFVGFWSAYMFPDSQRCGEERKVLGSVRGKKKSRILSANRRQVCFATLRVLRKRGETFATCVSRREEVLRTEGKLCIKEWKELCFKCWPVYFETTRAATRRKCCAACVYHSQDEPRKAVGGH